MNRKSKNISYSRKKNSNSKIFNELLITDTVLVCHGRGQRHAAGIRNLTIELEIIVNVPQGSSSLSPVQFSKNSATTIHRQEASRHDVPREKAIIHSYVTGTPFSYVTPIPITFSYPIGFLPPSQNLTRLTFNQMPA